ncbi:Oidioi.mRNA.OKI2018_I69.chr2.g5642.t1.cds [Oikopleura dioica]|uniref:Oidioi.mRNA.OKI2018_I69.chr2.g5642.t1.cds n=1 Tax=Oikopleura dioica TaxID=34765 RepID=A0ABN7T1G9_OIKDI|nr:Oidioi.mRNA.OKI2018_I69.chr2.g5642.t1.cds [Oikopleura dioica]
MGNWNSHPEQNIDREPPPTQFQDLDEASEYHADIIAFNDYGWIYIIGVVLIIFLVLGCCICLCRLGEDKAVPAASKGYQPVAEQEPVVRANTMYAALPEQMPAGFASQGQKQPSMMYPVVSPSPSMKQGQPYVPHYPPHMTMQYSQQMPPQYGYPQPMYSQPSRDSVYKPVPKAADRTGDARKSPSPEQKSVLLRKPDLSNVEEMSEIGTARSVNKRFVFNEDVFEENFIVEESLAENNHLLEDDRHIMRQNTNDTVQQVPVKQEEKIVATSSPRVSISSSSVSLCSEKSGTSEKQEHQSSVRSENEEAFEVVEKSEIVDEALLDESLKSDSQEKAAENPEKAETVSEPMPPFTISDFEKHVRGIQETDGAMTEPITPGSSLTNVTDASTEKNISTSQASLDSESTLKSEDLQVRRQETLEAFNEAEKSIHEANEIALQVLQTDTEDSLDFQEIDSDLATTLSLTSTTTNQVTITKASIDINDAGVDTLVKAKKSSSPVPENEPSETQ